MSFTAFAAAHGLILDHPIPDGRWHRVRTEDKPRKRNGSYLFDALRGVGVIRNWATMDECAVYKDETVRVDEAVMQAIRERVRRAREQEARRRNQTADIAATIVQKAQLLVPQTAVVGRRGAPGRDAVPTHPYLIRKGLPNASCLVVDGQIIVPMWVDKRLVNVQRIATDGTKRFLPGGTAKGAFYRLGNPRAAKQWLCEGYATALTVKLALDYLHADAAVLVCFSAGNLKEVGGTHVMADGDEAGRKGAEATGLPWVSAPDGMDANDLMQRDGLHAVVALLQGVRRQN